MRPLKKVVAALLLVPVLLTLAYVVAFVGFIVANQRSRVEAKIRDQLVGVRDIAEVHTAGYGEEFGTFTVTEVTFRVRGKGWVTLFVGDFDDALNRLDIIRIGNVRPTLLTRDRKGRKTPRSPAIGIAAEGRVILPWQLKSVSDLVQKYDDVIAYFEGWPEYPKTVNVATAVGDADGTLNFGWSYYPPTE